MSTQADLVIGIDCSTTACKAIVWTRDGTALGEGRAALDLAMPRPAWHEQQAEGWWLATAQAVRSAVSGIGTARLAALSIVHQRETFVLVDDAGNPLRSAIVWMDERARPLLPALRSLYGAERFHQITGKPLTANLAVAKLYWLRQNEPAVLDRAHKVLDVHSFLVHHLTGRFCTSWGSADPTGLFDMTTHGWAQELLPALGLRPGQLPELQPPGALLGQVSIEAARLCCIPAGLPVMAGLGDGQAAGLGANVTRPGMAYLNLGTAVVSGAHADNYCVSNAFRTTCSGVPGAFLLETVILGGAYTVSWFQREFAAGEDMDAACQAVPAGALGLMLVPYWNSAMNPYWDASATGLIAGWRGVHGKAHLYRAILEGVAFEQRLHTEGVEAALGRRVEGYVAMGGGSRSALWRQIIADVTGKPVACAATAEAAALGAGILAASGAGLFASVREAAAAMVSVDGSVLEPIAANHAFYSRLYEDVYRQLYPALRPYLARLTELTEEGAPDANAAT